MHSDLLTTTRVAITEIYASIQGESAYTGHPCTFVRLSGCPLRCRWCDTVYSFKQGDLVTITEVLAQIDHLGIQMVELTGGEPLAQGASLLLMQACIDRGYRVLLETGGSESIGQVPKEVHIIMDLKCPGSGMSERNHWPNLDALKPSDEIKFVIAHHEDFLWAKAAIKEHRLHERCQLALSPAWGHVKPADLTQWLMADRLPARLNLQIHKYIWGPKAKGV
jgi:7-carboxy-7-deazaguanine synthase